MPDFPFIKYHPKVFDKEQMAARAQEYYQYMNDRRTVREFSDKIDLGKVSLNAFFSACKVL